MGSGFYAFGFASLALANTLFTLVFFGVPAKSVRILAIVMAGILLLDMILILAVQKTRYEEGWVGTVSVVWTLLMSLWTLLTDRTVKWGKAEEEQRLTGRAETRRTLTEWLEVLLSTIAYVIMTVAAVLMTLTIILRALDAGLAPPGKTYWVDGGKYKVHVYCHGNKTDADGHKLPTALFEGGERSVEHDMWNFADNAVNNGSISRYCFADRPGIAWSDTAPSPLSASFATDVLSEALAKAGEDGPWVLASAGIGSVYQRVFSSRHGPEVAGLVLIDPLHEDFLPEVGSPGRGFLLAAWRHLTPRPRSPPWRHIPRSYQQRPRIWSFRAARRQVHLRQAPRSPRCRILHQARRRRIARDPAPRHGPRRHQQRQADQERQALVQEAEGPDEADG